MPGPERSKRQSAMIWLVAPLLLLAVVISAQAQEDLATWVGWKFGTTISYPSSLFMPMPEPDAHDGLTFISRDGARIAAYAYFNNGETIETIDASLQDSHEYGHVILRRRGVSSTVVSGARMIGGHEHVFFEKHFLEPGGEVVHVVEISYPVETKGIYGPFIQRIIGPLETSRYKLPE